MADTNIDSIETDCCINKSTTPQPGLVVNLSDHILTEGETSILSKVSLSHPHRENPI
jgi:hypothetical protein